MDLRRAVARANQVAHVLVDDLGLVSGNRVLLRSPNNPWTVAAWLGVLKAGGIVVTTMAALRATELTPIVQKTRPAVALVDHRHVEDVQAVRDSVAPDLVVVPYGGDTADDLARRVEGHAGEFTASDTAADDVALFGPTSGTTGVPKITTHFHRDVLSIDNTFGRALLELTPDDVVACTAPLAFTFGLGMLVVFPLRAGACALLDRVGHTGPARRPRRRARRHRAGHRADGVQADARLRPPPAAVRTAGRGVGRRAHGAGDVGADRGAARAEGGRRHRRDRDAAHLHLRRRDDIRPGATGRPVPGYRAAILDADGNELGDGKEGRLGVIGPVGCRYLDDERQRGYVVNGWNVTGDTFVRDADGYYFYRSRTDNMIVSSGYNIGGPEVEEALGTHPDVLEVGVVAAPDEVRGSIVCAFVVLREGVDGDATKVKELPGPREGSSWRRTSTPAPCASSRRCRATPAGSCSTSSCAR